MAQVNTRVGSFGIGTLVWILLTSLAVAVFFSRRVKRQLKEQGEPLDLRSIQALFSHSEYLRSDTYGALVSWIGCAVTIVALIWLLVRRAL